MSYKNKKSRPKRKNHNVSRKNKKNVKKINKTKLIIASSILLIAIFGVTKLTMGVGKVINDRKSIVKKESIVKGESIEDKTVEEQFSLDTENITIDKKYTVFIDPGHGGNDPGNLGVVNNKDKKVFEKDIALEISKKVAKILSNQNDIQVVISRTEDKYLSKEERSNMANAQNADVLVSIHLNAQQGDNSAAGVESYYSPKSQDDSDRLAKKIQETIVSYINVRDRGVKQGNLEVLNRAGMPAALIECGFLTNPDEEKKLLSDSYQNQLAEGIAQGILSYLDGKK